MATATYIGYSSFEFQESKELEVTDLELVKRDLVNHLFTPLGSRVMMSNYGTILDELVFEPMDEDVIYALEDEVRKVVDADPRVELLSIDAQPDQNNNSVTVSVLLFYIELSTTEELAFSVQFED